MIDTPTAMGILNAKTIAYAGFAILGLFLLILITVGLIELFKGGDIWALGLTAVTGAILLILAYIIIYNVANIYYGGYNETNETNMKINTPTAFINNTQLCMYPATYPCYTNNYTTSTTTMIEIYWEVPNGIGCCNDFNCDFNAFKSFCGTPFTTFKLYNVLIDDTQYDFNMSSWNYTCNYGTPWNNIYQNFTVGYHNITIIQKDCQTVIDTKVIEFTLIDVGGGMYGMVI
jgi:hypothetical protein